MGTGQSQDPHQLWGLGQGGSRSSQLCVCLSSLHLPTYSVRAFSSSSYFLVTHLHTLLPYHSFHHLPSEKAFHSYATCCLLPSPQFSSLETRTRVAIWHFSRNRLLWAGAGTSLVSHPLVSCFPGCEQLWLPVGEEECAEVTKDKPSLSTVASSAGLFPLWPRPWHTS